MTTTSRTTNPTTPVQDGRHSPDVAFEERRTDRLVIRRFQAQDASTLAAYRSDPTVARYQSRDSPFTLAQAQAFIDSYGATNPDTPGAWFQFALVEAAASAHHPPRGRRKPFGWSPIGHRIRTMQRHGP